MTAPHYTWRHAVAAFATLVILVAVCLALALLATEVIEPLPYRDPEPPAAT